MNFPTFRNDSSYSRNTSPRKITSNDFYKNNNNEKVDDKFIFNNIRRIEFYNYRDINELLDDSYLNA